MPASFIHPNGSVTFSRGPYRPDNSLAVVQPQRRSAASIRFGYAHTIVNDLKQLRIRATTTEKDQFTTFFNTIAQGMSELIEYTDPTGASITARFDRPTFSVIEIAYNAWEITVGLRIFAGGWTWPSGSSMLWPSGNTMGVQ